MKPFRGIDLREHLSKQKEKLKQAISQYSNDEIMANDINILADNLYEQFYVQPVTIFEEDTTRRSIREQKIQRQSTMYYFNSHSSDTVEVDGVCITFYFPFDGDSLLFSCRTSTFSLSGYPDISLESGYFSISYYKSLREMSGSENQAKITNELNRDVREIRSGIQYANADVVLYNGSLREYALQGLTDRKKRIESFYTIANAFEISLEKSEYAERQINIKRNITPIAHTYNTEKPYYCISDQDYSDILDVIKHTASTYERTPQSYRSMQEEDLRNALLATLNATYKGMATGETFRNKGKTDICIEQENRAAFVAECKMWKGQKEVEAALSQLDGYLTWRDCKAALLYFVRKKDFLRVLTVAKETLANNGAVRKLEEIDKNEFACDMISVTNPGQIVKVRVMLFNLYAGQD